MKTSTDYLLNTCYTNIDLHWGIWWYSPQLRLATFTGWILIIAVHCFLSNDTWAYSSVHTYSKILVLQSTFWPVQAHFHLLTHLCYKLFSVTTLNTVQVLLLGKIWLASAQTVQKDANLLSLLFVHLILHQTFCIVPGLFSMRNHRKSHGIVLPGWCTNS